MHQEQTGWQRLATSPSSLSVHKPDCIGWATLQNLVFLFLPACCYSWSQECERCSQNSSDKSGFSYIFQISPPGCLWWVSGPYQQDCCRWFFFNCSSALFCFSISWLSLKEKHLMKLLPFLSPAFLRQLSLFSLSVYSFHSLMKLTTSESPHLL